MRFSYKPIVKRFKIPRPTLIEWKKRAKSEPENWRVDHLTFLKNYIRLENETIEEIYEIGLSYKEIFIFAVCLYLKNIDSYVVKTELKVILKDFAYTQQNSVEFRHDFAKEIWSIGLEDGSGRFIADYYRVDDLLDKLTIFQYYVLFTIICDFVNQIRVKVDLGHSDGLVGKTWQELYSLQKEFSVKSFQSVFSKLIIEV